MRNGSGNLWLSAAGAFLVGWFVVSAAGLRRVESAPSGVDQLRTNAATAESALGSIEPSHASPQEGGNIEARVREIIVLAATNSEESSRYVKELYGFAARLSGKDFPRVLALLQKPGDKKQEKLRQELLAYWLEQDAAAARAYIHGLPSSEREGFFFSGNALNLVADTWARADPAGLLTWLKNLPVRERQAIRNSVRISVAQVLSQRDPATAIALLLESPDGDNAGNGIVESIIFRELARHEPKVAAEGAMRLQPGMGRWTALNHSLGAWLKADERAAIAWVREITDPQLALEATVTIAGNLALGSPETALALLVEQGAASAPDAAHGLESACREWIKRDSSRAFEWAHQLEAGATRDTIFATMLPILAKDEPQRAADLFLAEMARGGSMGNSAREIVQSLIKTGAPSSAITFLSQLPEREQQRATFAGPFYLLSDTSPAKIIDIGQQLPPGAIRDQWLNDSANSIIRTSGPMEMQRVLEQLPAGAYRDALASRSIVEAFRWKADPEAAIALSQSATNGRQYLMEGVVAWLGTSNPAPARNWLQQTRLFTQEEKQQLLQARSTADTMAPADTGSGTASGTRIPRP